MSSARRPLLGSVTAVPSLSFLDACHGVRQSAITETGMPYPTEVHSRLMSIHTDGTGFVLNGLSTRVGKKAWDGAEGEVGVQVLDLYQCVPLQRLTRPYVIIGT